MEALRAELLELDKKRKAIEEEIGTIVEYLESDGNPGVKGSLIDAEGFPLPGIDHYKIRESRNRLAILQTDLSSTMKIIEEKMSYFFGKVNEGKPIPQKEEKGNEKEPIALEMKEESLNQKGNIDEDITKEPFAIVANVVPDSPAFEAGLLEGDAITVFNGTLYKGTSVNPLQSLAKIANEKINQNIPIKVLRKDEKGIIQIVNLNLIPHQWSGRGILGCKLNLL